jgi:hypothetical protein
MLRQRVLLDTKGNISNNKSGELVHHKTIILIHMYQKTQLQNI